MAEPSPRQPRRRNRKIWVIAIVVAVIIAFGVNYSTRRVVSVRIAKAERGELISTLSTNGKVQPMRNFAAYSPIAATVEAVYVHAGEKVEAGTPLIALDDSAAKQAVASALAAVRGAQAQLDALRHGGTRQQQIMLAGDIDKARAASEQAAQRLQTLKKLQAQGAASESEVASAEDTLAAEKAALKVLQQQKTSNYTPIDLKHAKANLANAQSAYDAAQDTLKKENVRAPFTGTVYSILVRPSDFVHAGDKLLQMADLKQVQILAYFDEPEIGQLSDSEAVKIVWEAKPGRVWHGHIIRTPTTIINFGTRNVGEALISVDDADETLLPNTNVTITVTLRDLHNVLIVPREALHSDGTGNYVFELEGSHLKRTPVQIGALNLTQVQIVSGLSEGATIALSAPDGTALHDGLAVKRAR